MTVGAVVWKLDVLMKLPNGDTSAKSITAKVYISRHCRAAPIYALLLYTRYEAQHGASYVSGL